MANRFSDEQWRVVFDLAHVAAELPEHERLPFLESTDSSPDVIQQVLAVVKEFAPPVERSPSVGAQIGRFTLTGHLGRGGMGDVYAALDGELHRTVALKFITPEAIAYAGAMERFIREARTASALNHPNIVTVHEVIRSDATVAIVMEFVEGITLRQLSGKPLPLPQLLDIGEQIAQALEAAHAGGIVHRDIKPENMILRPDGRVKVMDFGLARWVASDRQDRNFTSVPGVAAGTGRYMSPEQCRGETVTSATDIFSFGLVLYELSTGKHPFLKNSVFETMQAITSEPPQPPSVGNASLPEPLELLILATLAKDPKLRPDAGTVCRTLAQLQSEQETPGAFRVPRHTSFTKRRKWLAASLALLLAGAAVWAWRVRPIRTRQPQFMQVTTLIAENRATAAAISPDGKSTAYANVDGIFVRSLSTGETRTVSGPDDFVVVRLAWFADNRKLVGSGFSPNTNLSSIWILSAVGGPPHLFRTSAKDGVPSPDGTRIAYLNADKSEVWVTPADGGEPRQILARPPGDGVPFVMWSADSRRIIVQRRDHSTRGDRIYDRHYESLDSKTGRSLAFVPGVWMDSAAALNDGRILFLRLNEPLGYPANEIWQVRTDPATGAFRGAPRRVAPNTGAEHMFSLSATADGKQAMVLIRSDQTTVFVADFRPSPPSLDHIRRLTLDERTNNPHAWTADSNAVIFESDRNGNFDIFKQQIDRRTPDTIVDTPADEVLPQLAPDGNTILFATTLSFRNLSPFQLNHVPVEGGRPEAVPLVGALDEFRCSPGHGGRCVLRNTVGRQWYVYYDLDPIQGKGPELARIPWQEHLLGDWDISPDGSLLAIPNHDPRSARISVVPLNAGSKKHDLVLPGLSDLTGAVWAADGSGWFVTSVTPIGRRMIFVQLDGRVTPLGDMYGWAVPSPDGRHLAFVDRMGSINAWTVNLR